MANIEKKKLEAAEMAEMMQESPPPEKPKLTRKPRKTKAVVAQEETKQTEPVDVKIDIDLGTSVAKEDTTPPEPEPAPAPAPVPHHPAVSAPETKPAWFDEDAFANKIVGMMMEKGIGLPPPPEPEQPLKKKRKPAAPKKPKTPEEMGFQVQQAPPPTTSFAWM